MMSISVVGPGWSGISAIHDLPLGGDVNLEDFRTRAHVGLYVVCPPLRRKKIYLSISCRRLMTC